MLTSSRGRLGAWIVILSIAGYPLVSAVSYLIGIENRPLSIAMRGALLIISLFVLMRFFSIRITPRVGAFWIAWWMFWIFYLARLLLDFYFNPSALQLPPSEYAIFSIGVCLIPAVAAALGNVNRTADYALNRLIWLMVVGTLLNLYIIFYLQNTGVEIDFGSLRVETETLNPIAIGHLGASILLLVFWKFNCGTGQSTIHRFFLFLAALVAVIAVVSSGSRGPVFSLVVALAVYAGSLPRHFFSRLTLFILWALFIVVLFNIDKLASTFLFSRLSEGVFEDDARSLLLGGAFDIIKSNPLFGGGVEPLETYPHNLVVESFLVFGVFTGLPFVFMIVSVLKMLLTIARVNSGRFWVCILFVQYLVAAMFSGALYTSNIFWILMALTVSLSAVSVSRCNAMR